MYSRLLILLGIKITFDIVCYTSFNINFFFFNDTATTEIYTLSLHDALPVVFGQRPAFRGRTWQGCEVGVMDRAPPGLLQRRLDAVERAVSGFAAEPEAWAPGLLEDGPHAKSVGGGGLRFLDAVARNVRGVVDARSQAGIAGHKHLRFLDVLLAAQVAQPLLGRALQCGQADHVR